MNKPQPIGPIEAKWRAEAAERRRRLMEVRPAAPRPVEPKPSQQRADINYDAHVLAFRHVIAADPIKIFIEYRSRELGTCAKDVLGSSRFHEHVAIRQQIIFEVWHKFGRGKSPNGKSLPYIAKVFGKDHSTLFHAIKKVEKQRGQIVEL